MLVLSQRIKELREKNKELDPKWTQKYIANILNIARVTYTSYENGTKQPPLEIVSELAGLFEVSTDYLLGRTNNPSSKANLTGIHIEIDLSDESINELKKYAELLKIKEMFIKTQNPD